MHVGDNANQRRCSMRRRLHATPMLPKLRLAIATIAAVLVLLAFAVGFLTAPRHAVLSVGLPSAQGSPVERSLPEPPDWKQFVALATARRNEELNRLLELPSSDLPSAEPVPAEPPAAADTTADAPATMPATTEGGETKAAAAPADAAPDAEITASIDRDTETAIAPVAPPVQSAEPPSPSTESEPPVATGAVSEPPAATAAVSEPPA